MHMAASALVAQAAAQAWLDAHPGGLTTTYATTNATTASAPTSSCGEAAAACLALRSLPGHNGSNLHLSGAVGSSGSSTGGGEGESGGSPRDGSSGQQWSINVGFHPPITSGSSLQDVQSYLAWIALDRCVCA